MKENWLDRVAPEVREYSIKEVAVLAGVSVAEVKKWLLEGSLVGHWTNKRRFVIWQTDLDRFLCPLWM